MDIVERKLKFLTGHLSILKDYEEKTINDIKKNYKDLKFVEKIIQEIVDCAVDINEYLVKKIRNEKPFSSKRSFRDLQNILEKHNLAFDEKELPLFIDTVSLRNEIVHSYDVNIYLIWGKRSIDVIINLYKNYTERILQIIKLNS